MSLSVETILESPGFSRIVRAQASALLAIQEANPRAAAVFATQQRWLLAHLALSMHFRGAGSSARIPPRPSTFQAEALERGVASRNTADAFLKEMAKYGFIEEIRDPNDRRVRGFAVSDYSRRSVSAWLEVHLTSLDALDGGARAAAFRDRPESIGDIQPRIADGFLKTRAIREPEPTFSLFTWLNEGGVVMDWLCAGIATETPGAVRYMTNVNSVSDFSARIQLSRSHLTRKLRAAESMGSLGWSGERGASTMWVSAGFLSEYHQQQAAKLAIIDSALEPNPTSPLE